MPSCKATPSGRLAPEGVSERDIGTTCHTHSAASPAPTRIQGVQSVAWHFVSATGAGIGLTRRDVVSVTASSATDPGDPVAAGAMASFAARSSCSRRSCLAFRAAAPARPAATRLGSFVLPVVDTGGVGAVTLSTGTETASRPVDSVCCWRHVATVCSASIFWRDVGITPMRTMSKSAVPQCG